MTPALALALALAMAAPATVQEESATDLRVMSFNIRYGTANDGPDRWENRSDLVIDTIRADGPDLLGLQEALRFQIDAILEALPDYRSVGVGRDDGKDAGEFSPVLYRIDRFELLGSGTFWLSDTPEVPGSSSWGNAIPRICSFARLRDIEVGTTIDVYNTHFDHQSAPSRFRSAELIWQVLEARSEAVPFVVMRDLNAGEDSEPIRFLLGAIEGPTGTPAPEPGLADPFRIAQPRAEEVGTFHGFRGTPGIAKIDHILVTPGAFEVLGAAINRSDRDGQYPSDHFPVTARLRLTP